jgi:hypothetical protein
LTINISVRKWACVELEWDILSIDVCHG